MKPKREYRRPEMTVVELKKQCYILAGSGGQGSASAGMSVTYDEEEI